MDSSSSAATASSSSSSASTPLPLSSSASVIRCGSAGCANVASLKCPTCVQLNLTPTLFCSQDCFKSSWKSHNSVHKIEKARIEFVPPPFHYTGLLRPAYVTPTRSVPESIQKPEYALSGQPTSEMQAKNTNTIPIYNKEEIEAVRKACKIGREALDLAHTMIRPGITTDSIDAAVHDYIISQGAYPSPLNYWNYPKSVCTSINEVICHGIPNLHKLEDGDIVNVDVSVYVNGCHGDLNETYTVGKVDDESKTLIKVTHDALAQCIQHARPGVLVREFGDIITKYVSKFGFSVVRTFVGHGIGKMFHAPPNVPHYAKNKAIGTLKPGMMFTIEPMINAGTYRDVTWPDDWTCTTADGKRSAQFEHTMLVTETGVEVLTARTAQSPKLWWESDADIATAMHASNGSSSSAAASPADSLSSTSSSAAAGAGAAASASASVVVDSKDSKESSAMMLDDETDESESKKKKRKKKKKGKGNAALDGDGATTAAE